ncbi:TolC family protein [Spirochaeta thermophila]|uniref:TolC family protein n=1 Tax=Winmispira thermophila TaxID=154 RepID=UPI001FE1CBF0|nr:TolC family protein [Spirochaeta thermophila]
MLPYPLGTEIGMGLETSFSSEEREGLVSFEILHPLSGYPSTSRVQTLQVKYKRENAYQAFLQRRYEVTRELLEIVRNIYEVRRDRLDLEAQKDDVLRTLSMYEDLGYPEDSLELERTRVELRSTERALKLLEMKEERYIEEYRSLTGVRELPDLPAPADITIAIPEGYGGFSSVIMAERERELEEIGYQDEVSPLPELKVGGFSYVPLSEFVEGARLSFGGLFSFSWGGGALSARVGFTPEERTLTLQTAVSWNISPGDSSRERVSKELDLSLAHLREELEVRDAISQIEDWRLQLEEYLMNLEDIRDEKPLVEREYQVALARYEEGIISQEELKEKQRAMDRITIEEELLSVKLLLLDSSIHASFVSEE